MDSLVLMPRPETDMLNLVKSGAFVPVFTYDVPIKTPTCCDANSDALPE